MGMLMEAVSGGKEREEWQKNCTSGRLDPTSGAPHTQAASALMQESTQACGFPGESCSVGREVGLDTAPLHHPPARSPGAMRLCCWDLAGGLPLILGWLWALAASRHLLCLFSSKQSTVEGLESQVGWSHCCSPLPGREEKGAQGPTRCLPSAKRPSHLASRSAAGRCSVRSGGFPAKGWHSLSRNLSHVHCARDAPAGQREELGGQTARGCWGDRTQLPVPLAVVGTGGLSPSLRVETSGSL